MKASGTTYKVPTTKRGSARAKIIHMATTCKARHVVQNNQNSNEVRFSRPNIRTPKSAQNVHMIAACHLCG